MADGGGSVELACGPRQFSVALPVGLVWERLEAARAVAGPRPDGGPGALAEALDRVGGERLARARSVVVLVPDETRPGPIAEWIDLVVGALAERRVAAERVTLLVAAGVHRGETPHEWVRRAQAAGARLERHDADAPLQPVGRCRGGLEIELNARYAEADLRLSLGGVSFHYFAGFGGGPKMVFPGVAARHAVVANHRRTLGPLPPGGLHPGCAPGRIEGNPVASEIAEAAALLPPDVALHFVASGGEWMAFEGKTGLAAARDAVLGAGARGSAGGADCVVASAGGTPHDVDLVQTHKALFHAAAYCRPGGAVVLWAEAAGGPGSDAMRRWLAVESLDELEGSARAAYDLNAQTAISLRRLTARHRVVWRGGGCPEWIARAGAVVAESDEAAWRLAQEARATGPWERGVVLPHAASVVPASNGRAAEA